MARRPHVRRSSYNSNTGWVAGIIFLLIALAIVAFIVLGIYGLVNKQHHTLLIKDKQTKVECHDGDCSDKYLIYTDKGVYQDTDNVFYLKFNSSDLYGKLEEGHTYDCTTIGFRIPFTSSYKNLIDCEEVAQ